MKFLKNIGSKIKKMFGGEVLGTAAGTFGGHAAIAFLFKFLEGNMAKVGEVIIKNITEAPPRARLEEIILGLTDSQRKFWEDRLSEAKINDGTKPSENDIVTAWCKPLFLKKMSLLVKNKDGNPFLDKAGKPVFYETGEILSDDDLRKFIYGKVADLGEKEFWIYTDLLIHDRWQQIFERLGKKFRATLKKNWDKIKKLYNQVMVYTENESNRAHQEVRAQREARRIRIQNITNKKEF